MSHGHADENARTGTHAPVPEPSLAEQARTLMHLGKVGSLSTLSHKHPDWPFGSVMPYGLDEAGRPTFLISALAMHTQHLQRDPRASLLIAQSDAEADPLGAARLTLMGTVTPVLEEDRESIRAHYLARHAEAKSWVDFGDFAFYRMDVTDSYFVGGFGVMGWVPAPDYHQAEVDLLADIAPSILQHMNTDHADTLVLLAQHFGQCAAEAATMTAVDRLGFHLQVHNQHQLHGLRLPFIREIHQPDEVRKVLVEMVQQARAAAP